jgi:hypothetical protein
MTDDDSLAYDLSAWQAPPPPAGLADAVVRRMTQPPRARRRVWVVAACAVAAAAAVLIALLAFDRRTEPAVETARLESERENRVEIERLLAELAELEAQLHKLEAKLPASGESAGTAPKAPAPKPAAPRSTQADLRAALATLGRMKPRLLACNDGSFTGKLGMDIKIDATGTIERLVFHRKVAFQKCLATILSATRFEIRAKTTISLDGFSLVFPKVVARTAAVCDADALHLKGNDAFQDGKFGESLLWFERSFACKADQRVIPKLMLAACTSKNLMKARQYYPRLSPAQAPSIIQRCLDHNIDPR